jgi:hypothetical protein
MAGDSFSAVYFIRNAFLKINKTQITNEIYLKAIPALV